MAGLKAWLAFKLIQENCGGFILIFGKTNTIMYSLKNKIKLKKKKRTQKENNYITKIRQFLEGILQWEDRNGILERGKKVQRKIL